MKKTGAIFDKSKQSVIFENKIIDGATNWVLHYNGYEEDFGSNASKGVEKIDRIYEETGGDIIVHVHTKGSNEALRKKLFVDKSYYKDIPVCVNESIVELISGSQAG